MCFKGPIFPYSQSYRDPATTDGVNRSCDLSIPWKSSYLEIKLLTAN